MVENSKSRRGQVFFAVVVACTKTYQSTITRQLIQQINNDPGDVNQDTVHALYEYLRLATLLLVTAQRRSPGSKEVLCADSATPHAITSKSDIFNSRQGIRAEGHFLDDKKTFSGLGGRICELKCGPVTAYVVPAFSMIKKASVWAEIADAMGLTTYDSSIVPMI